MKEKKSFLLHIDSLDILEKLSDEQAGKLFKAISAYHNGSDYELDNLLDLVFTPFKNQFGRDLEKYKKVSEKRALAGKKGGKQKQSNLANASKCKQNVANLADSDNDSDKDSDSDSDNERNIIITESKIPISELIEIYNEECSALPKVQSWNSKQKRISQLKARWTESKERQNLDWWRSFFRWCNTNPSLNGSSFDWIADLEAITNQSKFTRLLEKGSL